MSPDHVHAVCPRMDPFSVVRTMAYQMALTIPEAQQYLLNLDHSKV